MEEYNEYEQIVFYNNRIDIEGSDNDSISNSSQTSNVSEYDLYDMYERIKQDCPKLSYEKTVSFVNSMNSVIPSNTMINLSNINSKPHIKKPKIMTWLGENKLMVDHLYYYFNFPSYDDFVKFCYDNSN